MFLVNIRKKRYSMERIIYIISLDIRRYLYTSLYAYFAGVDAPIRARSANHVVSE